MHGIPCLIPILLHSVNIINAWTLTVQQSRTGLNLTCKVYCELASILQGHLIFFKKKECVWLQSHKALNELT